ncbi:Crp/Fnr family transcriptional regulator [Oceanicella sp. SM1341]|uniref:Crp/Fnr family transcriptional regulator n=1 Tax=Oceanicella sp. SM1341 TaxID=1548889 RepID=UPI0013001863|nr:helix-turn-helix domain-containing protein [Oceanicella sp. SM1341]
MSDLLLPASEQRLAATLLRLVAAQDTPRLRISQSELGATANVSRNVVSRILGRFSRKGWVELGYGCVEVRDAAALTASFRAPAEDTFHYK